MQKPNPNCKSCHGLNVNVRTRGHEACAFCWPMEAKAMTTSIGAAYISGRSKRLEKAKRKLEDKMSSNATIEPEVKHEEDE